MRGAKTNFNRIKNAVDVYKQAVLNSMIAYRGRAEAIRQQAHAYKDESGFVREHLPEYQKTARAEIERAKRELDKKLEEERISLEKQLYEVVSAVPDKNFTELLRFYRDFGIVPNRMDVGSLLTASHGNALSIKALNVYLTASGSKYNVSATPYETFSADLDRLTRLQRMIWLSYETEAAEVFNGQPRTLYKPDGTAYRNGTTWDSVSRMMEASAFDLIADELEKHSDAWASDVLPQIEETENQEEKPRDLPPIDEVPEDNGELAKELGKRTAEGNKLAREVVGHYAR